MGDWWIDEEPWPGPAHDDFTFTGFFTSLGVAYARGAGKTDLAKYLTDLDVAFRDLSSSTANMTRDEVLASKKQKQHGPYRGGFDRRGRKI